MKKVLVIGDSCRDVFVQCEANRLCPDAPVPVLNIIKQTENKGMAFNVQANILALDVSCDILTNPNWHEITKTRYVHAASNHAFFRVDSPVRPVKVPLHKSRLEDYDMIVISDYDKGFLTHEEIATICSIHDNVFVDTKKKLGSWLKDARYIKINNPEYIASEPYIDSTIKEKIVRTMGSQGCEHAGIVYPVDRVEVLDVSGAGDTFLAGLCVSYLKDGNIQKAIQYANRCAASVVRHRGVSVVNPNGI